MGHDHNDYSESKRNDHSILIVVTEQRNKVTFPSKKAIGLGGFSLFADCGDVMATFNRPVERSGDGKTSNAGAEYVGVSDCNKVYKEAGNEAVMSISVDDCIDLDGMERSILAKVKDLIERCCLDRPGGSAWHSWAQRFKMKLGAIGGECKVFRNLVSDGQCSLGYVCILGPNMNRGGRFRVLILWKEGMQRVSLVWMKLENVGILGCRDSCRFRFPKNVNNDSVSPSSRFCERRMLLGGIDLVVTPLMKRVRDVRYCILVGCIKDCMKRLEVMLVRFWGSFSGVMW
ncbi:hypothetical protein Tco_0662328 [Tanacetum coccineum]